MHPKGSPLQPLAIDSARSLSEFPPTVRPLAAGHSSEFSTDPIVMAGDPFPQRDSIAVDDIPEEVFDATEADRAPQEVVPVEEAGGCSTMLLRLLNLL